MAGPSGFMKANKPERRPPFELPTHKSHRGKRDAERLIAGRNGFFDYGPSAEEQRTLIEDTSRRDSDSEDAIGRQVLGKKAQEIRPLLTIQMWVVVSADLITVLYSSFITLIAYTPFICISGRYLGGTIQTTAPITARASKMSAA